MRRICLALLLLATFCRPDSRALAADSNAAPAQTPSPQPSAITGELRALVAKINSKLQAGTTNADAFTEEVKGFDAILAKYPGNKSDDAAQVLYMKGTLYMHLDDTSKALAIMTQLNKDFPDSKFGKGADLLITRIKMQSALAAGSPFPDFSETDLEGKPLSVANYKGKVVMIDFWATWCGPCRAELPNVISVYEKYHSKGFEIIGVSLDKQEDKAKLTSFLTENKMTWPQYFDGQFWDTKLAAKYGIDSIPATYLIDGDGKIIGSNFRGPALEEAVRKALKL